MFTSAFQALGAPWPTTVPLGSGQLQQLPNYESLCRTEGSGLGSALRTCMDSAVWQTSTQAVSTGPGVCPASYTSTWKILIPIRPRTSWGSRDAASHLSFLPGGRSQGVAIQSSLLEFSGSAVRPDLRP